MRALLAAVSIGLIAASAGARAQVSFTQPTVDPLAIAVMSDFARCVADTDPVGARGAVAADYHASGYYPYIKSFAIGHKQCLHGGKLRFNQLLLVGGMAEELTRKSGLTAAQLSAAAARDEDTVPERCLIHKQPAATWALFATTPGSRAEGNAIDALRADYQACIPPDRTPVYNTLSLRALLALAVYRLTNQAPAVPAKGRN